MISKAAVEKALKIIIPLSAEMQDKLILWNDVYKNEAPWIREDIRSISLGATISSDFARLTLNSGKSWIASGTERAEYIQRQYSRYMKHIRTDLEKACALGGMVLKPYVQFGEIYVDAIGINEFFPVAFDSDGVVTSAVFVDRKMIQDFVFTRLEYHEFDVGKKRCNIKNLAFMSKDEHNLGTRCSLETVSEWSGLAEDITLSCEKPLFAYFRFPGVNIYDMNSPLGMSCFSKAVNHIQDADEHWALIKWEYDGSQLAIDAPEDIFRKDKYGKLVVPKRMQRLFRTNDYDVQKDMPIKEFSPQIRDDSLFNGFNRILQRVEFNCSLAYGTISDPQVVEKTAEEIRAGKDRSRSTIKDIQTELENTLSHLIWCINEYSNLYNLAPSGNYETVFEWGDGVTEDRDKEFARRLQLVTAGLLKKEKFVAWYFGCSDEEAVNYIPMTSELFEGDG